MSNIKSINRGRKMLLFFSVPGMGDDLAVKVRYRLGSRNC